MVIVAHPDDAEFTVAGTVATWAKASGPHRVRQVYVFGNDKPTVWVDVTETIEQTIAALKQHTSQMGDWDPTEMIKGWNAEVGKEKGLAYAESYRVITLERHGATD